MNLSLFTSALSYKVQFFFPETNKARMTQDEDEIFYTCLELFIVVLVYMFGFDFNDDVTCKQNHNPGICHVLDCEETQFSC